MATIFSCCHFYCLDWICDSKNYQNYPTKVNQKKKLITFVVVSVVVVVVVVDNDDDDDDDDDYDDAVLCFALLVFI